jgi:hypothetical protein
MWSTQGNAPMSQPIVFISHFQVKSGGLDDYRRLTEQVTRQLGAEKPRTVAFLHYLDPELSRVTIVHVFPDSPAMDKHFEGAADRSKTAFQYISPLGWEIYGPASDAAVATIRKAAQAAGVDLAMAAQHLGGFLRFGSR